MSVPARKSVVIENSNLQLDKETEEYILMTLNAGQDKQNKLANEMLFRLAKEVKDSGLLLDYNLILLKQYASTIKLSQSMSLRNSKKVMLTIKTSGTDEVALDDEHATMTAPQAVIKMFKLYDESLVAGAPTDLKARFVLDKVKSTILTIDANAKYNVTKVIDTGGPIILVTIDSVTETSLMSHVGIAIH